MKIAVKDDWSNLPMPEQSTSIEINKEFTKKEMDNIRVGFIPQQMEEKWFIYYDQSDNKLHFLRSWTGMCIFILQFVEKTDQEGSFIATTAEVNRDPSQYKCSDDDRDRETLLAVLDAHLLGRFPDMGGNPLENWSTMGKYSLPQ